jgi:hypothetical protein
MCVTQSAPGDINVSVISHLLVVLLFFNDSTNFAKKLGIRKFVSKGDNRFTINAGLRATIVGVVPLSST